MPGEIGNPPQVLPAKVTFRSLSLKLGVDAFEGACLRTPTGTRFLARLRNKLVGFVSAFVFEPPRPFERGTRWASDWGRWREGG